MVKRARGGAAGGRESAYFLNVRRKTKAKWVKTGKSAK